MTQPTFADRFYWPPGPWPHLQPGEVHLWLADLDCSAEELEAHSASLTEDELARANRFRFIQHRRAFIAARGSLRRLLGHYLGVPAARVQLVYAAFGKPELRGDSHPQPLRFNLAHSRDRALYGFVRDFEIGVDLECVDPRRAMADIVRRFFAPAEAAAFRSLPVAEQAQAFFELWTRKEAYVKACGKGLSIPLGSFAVSRAQFGLPTPVLLLEAQPQARAWTTVALDVGAGYAGSIAVPAVGLRLTHSSLLTGQA